MYLTFSPYRSSDSLTAADADARDFTGRRLLKAMEIRLSVYREECLRRFEGNGDELLVQTRAFARRSRNFSTRRSTYAAPTVH